MKIQFLRLCHAIYLHRKSENRDVPITMSFSHRRIFPSSQLVKKYWRKILSQLSSVSNCFQQCLSRISKYFAQKCLVFLSLFFPCFSTSISYATLYFFYISKAPINTKLVSASFSRPRNTFGLYHSCVLLKLKEKIDCWYFK